MDVAVKNIEAWHNKLRKFNEACKWPCSGTILMQKVVTIHPIVCLSEEEILPRLLQSRLHGILFIKDRTPKDENLLLVHRKLNELKQFILVMQFRRFKMNLILDSTQPVSELEDLLGELRRNPNIGTRKDENIKSWKMFYNELYKHPSNYTYKEWIGIYVNILENLIKFINSVDKYDLGDNKVIYIHETMRDFVDPHYHNDIDMELYVLLRDIFRLNEKVKRKFMLSMVDVYRIELENKTGGVDIFNDKEIEKFFLPEVWPRVNRALEKWYSDFKANTVEDVRRRRLEFTEIFKPHVEPNSPYMQMLDHIIESNRPGSKRYDLFKDKDGGRDLWTELGKYDKLRIVLESGIKLYSFGSIISPKDLDATFIKLIIANKMFEGGNLRDIFQNYRKRTLYALEDDEIERVFQERFDDYTTSAFKCINYYKIHFNDDRTDEEIGEHLVYKFTADELYDELKKIDTDDKSKYRDFLQQNLYKLHPEDIFLYIKYGIVPDIDIYRGIIGLYMKYEKDFDKIKDEPNPKKKYEEYCEKFIESRHVIPPKIKVGENISKFCNTEKILIYPEFIDHRLVDQGLIDAINTNTLDEYRLELAKQEYASRAKNEDPYDRQYIYGTNEDIMHFRPCRRFFIAGGLFYEKDADYPTWSIDINRAMTACMKHRKMLFPVRMNITNGRLVLNSEMEIPKRFENFLKQIDIHKINVEQKDKLLYAGILRIPIFHEKTEYKNFTDFYVFYNTHYKAYEIRDEYGTSILQSIAIRKFNLVTYGELVQLCMYHNMFGYILKDSKDTKTIFFSKFDIFKDNEYPESFGDMTTAIEYYRKVLIPFECVKYPSSIPYKYMLDKNTLDILDKLAEANSYSQIYPIYRDSKKLIPGFVHGTPEEEAILRKHGLWNIPDHGSISGGGHKLHFDPQWHESYDIIFSPLKTAEFDRLIKNRKERVKLVENRQQYDKYTKLFFEYDYLHRGIGTFTYFDKDGATDVLQKELSLYYPIKGVEKKYGIMRVREEGEEKMPILLHNPVYSITVYLLDTFYKYQNIIDIDTKKILDVSNIGFSLEAIKIFKHSNFKSYDINKDIYHAYAPMFLLYAKGFEKLMEYIAKEIELLQTYRYGDTTIVKWEDMDNYLSWLDSDISNEYDFLFSFIRVNNKIGYNTYWYQYVYDDSRIVFWLTGLLMLKKHGNAILMLEYVKSESIVDLYIFTKSIFERVELVYPNIGNYTSMSGIQVLCFDFKGVEIESIKKIIKSMIKKNPDLSKNFSVPKAIHSKYEDFEEFKDDENKDKNNNITLKSLFGDIDKSEAIKHIIAINNKISNGVLDIYKKIENYVNSTDQQRKQIKLQMHQIKIMEGIGWATKHNLPINPAFEDKIFKDYFGKSIINSMLNREIEQAFTFNKDQLEFESNLLDVNFDRMNQLNLELETLILAIDTRDLRVYRLMREKYEYYYIKLRSKLKSININESVITQAFLKMYEIVSFYKDEFFEGIKDTTFRSFHGCEAPGAFIIATNHYIKTMTDVTDFEWYAQSLNSELTDAFGDDFGLIKKYRHRWLDGLDQTGDITNMANIDWYKEYCKDVDLLTFDCGLTKTAGILMHKVDLHMMYFVLQNSKIGACCALKAVYPFEREEIVSMIYYLYLAYDRIDFYKPRQNYTSSEFYIVCIGFKGLDENILLEIKDRLINDKSVEGVVKIDPSFMAQFITYYEKLMLNNIDSIKKKLYLVDSYDQIDKDKSIDKFLKDINAKKIDEWLNKFPIKKIDSKDRLI